MAAVPIRPGCSFALFRCFFFFNVTATTEIYTLSLHDALPIFWPFGPASGLRGSPRRDGAWPTSPILCVSIFFRFMMRPTHGRLLPDFASQSVVLRPEKRVQHFTPPPASVVGPFVPSDARARLQAEAPRGGKHAS